MKIFQFLIVALGMGSPVINPRTGVNNEKITSKDMASGIPRIIHLLNLKFSLNFLKKGLKILFSAEELKRAKRNTIFNPGPLVR